MERLDRKGIVKKLLPADILLVSEKGLKHSINRAIGRSRWHHVMLYIGEGMAIEVTPKKGCHISKLDLTKDCYKAYKAVRCKKLAPSSRKKMADAAIRLFLGKKFDWQQLVKVFFRRTLTWKGNRGDVQKETYKCELDSLICSNLVAIIYHMAGHSVSSKWAPEYVMPSDYDKLEETGKFGLVFERKLE